jgi:hypothetical protein
MKTENELIRRLVILSARRLVRPSVEDSAEMTNIFLELYEKTGNEDYNLFPKKPVKHDR